jgi:lactate dehydrogenase-like 2-hydroxyacid dehydrogenase
MWLGWREILGVRMKPVVLQLVAYPGWDQAPLEAAYEVVNLATSTDPAALLAAEGGRVQAIATHGGKGVPAEIWAACPKAEIVAIYGVGYDAVDLDLARARGVRVTNTPDVLTEDCADLAVGMLLALARGIVRAEAHARGPWAAGPFGLTRRVSGMKVGVLGLGRIGAAVAERLKGFGCEIGYLARADKANGLRFFAEARELAAWADALIVTAASTAQTRHIVDAEVLAALGRDGFLVNIARAACIDEAALLAALEAGEIAGAALDVFEGEPAIDPRFLSLGNVVLQPHHASGTVETRRAMGALMRANLAAHFAGEALITPVV